MKKIISLVTILFLANVVCFAQVKSFKVEATEDVPSNKSQDEVVAGLMKSLTNEAIEKAGINLKNYKLSETEYDEFIKAVPKVEIKNKPIKKLPKDFMEKILYGTGDEEIDFEYHSSAGTRKFKQPFEGVIPTLDRRYRDTKS